MARRAVCAALFATLVMESSDAFSILPRSSSSTSRRIRTPSLLLASKYMSPEASAAAGTSYSAPRPSKADEPPFPKVGDFCRYYDMDGGKADGEVLIGRISLIQEVWQKKKKQKTPVEIKEWLVELTELENVGDGYYADYPSRKRNSKRSLRNLQEVAPVMASFVRAESAYKLPCDRNTGLPLARFESYRLDDYEGPVPATLDQDVVTSDGVLYTTLKGQLLQSAALAGLAGTVGADLLKGFEDAAIYAAGASAGVAYLFCLSIKTDTLGSPNAKFGKNISNVRFALPLAVLVGVALFNKLSGAEASNVFSTVSSEQFGAAMLGFLTYRIPLFVTQLFPIISETAGDMMLPGSAGVAMQLAKDNGGNTDDETNSKEKQRGAANSVLLDVTGENGGLVPVLVVSGPGGAGKTTLVNRLIKEGGGRFVRPKRLDRIQEGATFERLEQRGEFLDIDPTGRYGLTKDGILTAAATASLGEGETPVVVVDASVALVKKLRATLGGARLIGVWVALDTLDKFKERIQAQMESGAITIDTDNDGDDEESITRAKLREIVQEIEYGVVSGIFEFTILNDDIDTSFAELQEAAKYCFK
eukprot:CAMPEP_0198297556 /NCGR_PEP_ID=MMETSP1449-20131203/37191_1 /TAXON_ID=420275 /ORGANISM="Attheya septentrionalis, Strain CCMP2084" /LENGTH=588 /DNA_ID=CAMNT_0043998515 /DNA_START=79 /DNA_END=1845 /DNA_ORIENTATION=+